MKNSEIAEGAAEVLKKEGWTRGAYHRPSEGFCLLGAAMVAQGMPSVEMVDNHVAAPYRKYDDRAQKVLSVASDNPDCRVCVFNDHDCKTVEEAIDFATKAAKYWRDRGE